MFRKYHAALAAFLVSFGIQNARADLPFLKELAGNNDLPRTYGIGVDALTMRQQYNVRTVDIGLPGLVVTDPSVLDVDSKIDHLDIKLDAWIFPFLNVFAIAGTLDGETTVDLSNISLPQIPVPLGAVNIDYDGTVFGAGFTAVYGQRDWFGSLTATYTDPSLDGDFTSSVDTVSLQPRLGKRYKSGSWWVGATYLATDESHSGTISLGIPTVPALPFEVELESSEEWNLNAGVQVDHSKSLQTLLELGLSGRTHVLGNVTWRF
jgi:hypothetical protein